MTTEAKHLTEREKTKICFYESEIAMLNNAIRRTIERRDELREALYQIVQQVDKPEDLGAEGTTTECVVVTSRYGEPRQFHCIDGQWYYNVCGDPYVSVSRRSLTSIGHVDPSGGPYVGVGTNLHTLHEGLPHLTVESILKCEDTGFFKLKTKG